MKIIVAFILFFWLALLPYYAKEKALAYTLNDDPQAGLINDLLTVEYWNKRLSDRMPVSYNHFLLGGYFNMPSARMGQEGDIGAGFAYVPPYHNYNLRFELTNFLEISGNYRVFRNVQDPVLSQYGFGDFSDKGANIKVTFLHPEDSDYLLPGAAVGFEDFMGTRAFKAHYVVLTHVFLKQNLEISLGYGAQRIKGWFGGLQWIPFRKSGFRYLETLSLVAEYDAVPYKNCAIEPHPHGRVKKSPINFGLKYRLWDQLDFSLSYVRGDALAFSASTFYNFGSTKGFLPKISDPLPYSAPINLEPLGPLRPEEVMVQDLIYAFRVQGFEILQSWLSYSECGLKELRLRISNEKYRLEAEVRNRLNYLLADLIPLDIDSVVVVIDEEGFCIQEYQFQMEYVRAWSSKEIGPYELRVLSPLKEATFPNHCVDRLIFDNKRDWLDFGLMPRSLVFFGSARGKFKYSLGVNACFNGFLTEDLFYHVVLGYPVFHNLEDLHDVDLLNPSQLINVRTDISRYYKQTGLLVDKAYLQKNWTMGKGWYSRLALGYFEEEYGGAAAEFLRYPVNSNWAVGFEGALLGKRTVKGLGFTDKIRKLKGFKPTYRKFLGWQCFFDLYYDWKDARLEFKLMSGKFLANDLGARLEVSRYFSSGMRVSFWYTMTNGNDHVNGQLYHDKGIWISMPLDIFYTHSSCSQWNYGMSAWLRDVGVFADTGSSLYYLINNQRQ